MARTIKHQAVVYLTTRDTFIIIKILDGRAEYRVETEYAIDAYHCAMDMARDEGNRIHIQKYTAKRMYMCGCAIDSEWNVIDDDTALFDCIMRDRA